MVHARRAGTAVFLAGLLDVRLDSAAIGKESPYFLEALDEFSLV